jgi:N utilization substance protein B
MVDWTVMVDRRKARKLALQVLYEIDGARHKPDRTLDSRLQQRGLSLSDERYARKLVEGVVEQKSEIDTIISTYASDWPIIQIAMVDRNLLRVSIYEIMLDNETPPKVAINEAVELAKIFGADSSSRFVNGVLGSVMQTLATDYENRKEND